MADNRLNSYCNTREVSRYYHLGSLATDAQSVSSISTTTITFASATIAALFTAGDVVKIASTETPRGEFRDVYDVSGATITTDSNLTGTHTNAITCQPLSCFTPSSTPTSDEVIDMIVEQEDYIDDYTKRAWRVATLTDFRPKLYPQVEGRYSYRIFTRAFLPVSPIITPVASTDYIYVFEGTTEVEYVANKTNARNSGDYWVCEERGFIDFYGIPFKRYTTPIRIDSLRYGVVGASNVANPPNDIRTACAKLVAAELLMSEPVVSNVPGGEGGPTTTKQADEYKEDAHRILDRRRRILIE